MAYSINPYLPRARAIAMQLLIREGLPLSVVANRCGVHRSTIWRWKRKWEVLNETQQLANPNRPGRSVHGGARSAFRLNSCRWLIPTISSRPHISPRAMSERVVARVLALRASLKRCAEVIWHHITHIGDEHGTARISLSSVRRILRRHHCFDGARKPRVKRDNPKRPLPTKPGELVQTDTIHHVDPYNRKRLYYYTVIDLYTRMAYAILAPKLAPGLAAHAVLEAQKRWGFPISMVQADNGPEYGRYFEQQLKTKGIKTRHSRLHRPNDNAHIERFNRTIQTECIGHCWRRSVPLQRQQDRLTADLEYYNKERVHLGLQMRTPGEMLQRF